MKDIVGKILIVANYFFEIVYCCQESGEIYISNLLLIKRSLIFLSFGG
jgi:hypothetical protein